MCIAQGNIAGRVLGKSTFAKLDPVMGAAERFDAKTVAPAMKGMVSPKVPQTQTQSLAYQDVKEPMSQALRRPRANTSDTLLTGGINAAGPALGRATLLGQ